MEYRGIGVGVVGAVAILSMVLAAGTIWLLLTNPVTVATAVNEGEITPFARDLANIILQALQGLLKYL
jgi:hypothetical protein